MATNRQVEVVQTEAKAWKRGWAADEAEAIALAKGYEAGDVLMVQVRDEAGRALSAFDLVYEPAGATPAYPDQAALDTAAWIARNR